jgi:hypothetical protein
MLQSFDVFTTGLFEEEMKPIHMRTERMISNEVPKPLTKCSVFWDITQCSPLQINRLALFTACFMLVSSLAYSSVLKMVICSSETSVDYTALCSRC